MKETNNDCVLPIERVPLRSRGRGITDTMRRLKVGESFLLPVGCIRNSANAARRHIQEQSGREIKITVRQEGKTFRVWRTA